MARNISPDSVKSKVKILKINESLKLDNPFNSVAVMVSGLKKEKENESKIFKIKSINQKTIVTRIK
jgi:hypothetical protein